MSEKESCFVRQITQFSNSLICLKNIFVKCITFFEYFPCLISVFLFLSCTLSPAWGWTHIKMIFGEKLCLDHFKPAPHIAELPAEKIDSTYKRLRWQVFAGIFFGYAATILYVQTLT